MTRRPPSSTLFPYTPLFRSHHVQPLLRQRKHFLPVRVVEIPRHVAGHFQMLHLVLADRDHMGAVDQNVGGPGATLDRKSTRLNSSHANISYAVFCLKKKKMS